MAWPLGGLTLALLLQASAALATSSDRVERGHYVARAGNCISCHTRAGGAPFSGGRALHTPLGTLYSANITPDAQTGIGGWTVRDLRRALHEGLAADGSHLFPACPYPAYTKVSDEDIDALYAYLRTVKAVRYRPPANGLLFRQRWALGWWKALYFKPARFRPDPSQSAEWNRGAYLVEGLGHCGACHSPRNWSMAEVGDRAYAGGVLLDEVAKGKVRRWSGVNLTPAQSGLAAWSLEELTKYLNTGYSRRAGTFGPMNKVIVNSTRHLTAQDARAIAVYLKSLPARESKEPSVSAEQAAVGKPIYEERCEKCHGAAGRGGLFTGPPLAGSAIVQAEDPASLINVVLYGPELPQEVAFGAWETMKPYFDVLTDAQVAAVANHVRGSWNNRARPVRAAEVAQQR